MNIYPSGMGSRFGRDPIPRDRDPWMDTRDAGAASISTIPPTSRIRGVRSWKAGEVSRLTASIPSIPLSADDYIERKLARLVARSRHVCQNVEQISGFILDLEAGVLRQKGLRLQPLAKVAERGSDELDEDLNRAVLAAWTRWTSEDHADVGGRLSFRDIESQHLRALVEDGEFLARKVTGPDAGPFGFALQVLDPMMLPLDYKRDLDNGNFIRFGIEYNAWCRPVRYHLLDVNPGKLSYWHASRAYRPVPASEIIHDFIPLLRGQKRGVPHTATVLFRTLLVDGYDDAAITNARAGANKVGIIYSPDGMTNFRGEKGPTGEIEVRSEPGEFEHLPDGAQFVPWDPTYPHGEYPSFMAEQNRRLSAGLGGSYCRISRDMRGVSWSTLRSEELSTEEVLGSTFRTRALRLASGVYRAWVEMALLAGAIRYVSGPKAGKTVDPLDLDRLLQHRFRAGRRPWVDPLKETQALVLKLHNGLESWTGYFEDQGEDVREVFEEIARDRELAAEIGIPLPDPADATKLLLAQSEPESEEKEPAATEDDADRLLALVGS